MPRFGLATGGCQIQAQGTFAPIRRQTVERPYEVGEALAHRQPAVESVDSARVDQAEAQGFGVAMDENVAARQIAEMNAAVMHPDEEIGECAVERFGRDAFGVLFPPCDGGKQLANRQVAADVFTYIPVAFQVAGRAAFKPRDRRGGVDATALQFGGAIPASASFGRLETVEQLLV